MSLCREARGSSLATDLGRHRHESFLADRDEDAFGLGRDGSIAGYRAAGEDLSSFDAIDAGLEHELLEERRRPAIADGQRSRHTGIPGQRLRHPEHFIEGGGEKPAVNMAGRAFVGDAEGGMAFDAIADHGEANRRRERICHPDKRAMVEKRMRISGVRDFGKAFVSAGYGVSGEPFGVAFQGVGRGGEVFFGGGDLHEMVDYTAHRGGKPMGFLAAAGSRYLARIPRCLEIDAMIVHQNLFPNPVVPGLSVASKAIIAREAGPSGMSYA